MNISWYGHSCFKIQTKNQRGGEEVTIFVDPFDKSIGLRPPQGNANIALVTHDHHDHNNVAVLKGDPIVINSPGEYSIKDTHIIGIESFHDDKGGAERGRNTIYVIESEGLRICHLGDLGHVLDENQVEKIDGVDVLMIPVGGKYTLDSKKAEEVVGQIDPKIIIPMHYKIKGLNIDVGDEKAFCTDVGSCVEKGVGKLNIKKKDLENTENKIIIMEVANS